MSFPKSISNTNKPINSTALLYPSNNIEQISTTTTQTSPYFSASSTNSEVKKVTQNTSQTTQHATITVEQHPPISSIKQHEVYTIERLYTKIIKPMFNIYPEFAYFADKGVAITHEMPGHTQKSQISLTQLLIRDNLIKDTSVKDDSDEDNLRSETASKVKYIELERTGFSLIALDLFIQGNVKAYSTFIAAQPQGQQLSEDNFNQISQLAKEIINKYGRNVVNAMLIYSDLGKTSLKNKAIPFGINNTDHDNWLESVLMLTPEQISQIIPSYAQLNENEQKLLSEVAQLMKVHLGHVLHIEGGSKMFENFEKSIKESKHEIPEILLKFAQLIQLCDVAASAAHVNNQGCVALQNEVYDNGYKLAFHVLEKMRKDKLSAKEALQFYTTERGNLLGITNTNNTPDELVMVRLACMLRFYNEPRGTLVKNIYNELSSDHKQILIEQFGLETGINQFKYTPTYVPAVLVNLYNAIRRNPNRNDYAATVAAIRGAVCLAKITQKFAAQGKSSDNPLCFNLLSKLSTSNPAIFMPDDFDATKFEINQNNDLIYVG